MADQQFLTPQDAAQLSVAPDKMQMLRDQMEQARALRSLGVHPEKNPNPVGAGLDALGNLFNQVGSDYSEMRNQRALDAMIDRTGKLREGAYGEMRAEGDKRNALTDEYMKAQIDALKRGQPQQSQQLGPYMPPAPFIFGQ